MVYVFPSTQVFIIVILTADVSLATFTFDAAVSDVNDNFFHNQNIQLEKQGSHEDYNSHHPGPNHHYEPKNHHDDHIPNLGNHDIHHEDHSRHHEGPGHHIDHKSQHDDHGSHYEDHYSHYHAPEADVRDIHSINGHKEDKHKQNEEFLGEQ